MYLAATLCVKDYSCMTNIIVPLYNEEKRASSFITDLIEFCVKHPEDYRITFVNDGSTDNTAGLLEPLMKNHPFIHLIYYSPNRGKGYAIKQAVQQSGMDDYIIFIDADGSIAPEEILLFSEKLHTADVVVGSRAMEHSNAIQPPLRKLVGVIFNIIADTIFLRRIKDNLCGIKGFNKQAAALLFGKLITDRWVFDVELFYRIEKEKLVLLQVPIRWEHKTGSKIKLYDPFLMFINLVTLRIKLFLE